MYSEGLLFGIMNGLFTIAFSAYCITTGVQELRNTQILNARYFEIFGLLFEVLTFMGGFLLFAILFSQDGDLWRLVLLSVWQLGLLALILTDFRKIRTN